MLTPTEGNNNMVEERTQQFWKVSRAWRGINGEHKGWTASKIFDTLHPVKSTTIPNRHGVAVLAAVARQAEDLAALVVKDQVHRPEHFEGAILQFASASLTNNSGQTIQAA